VPRAVGVEDPDPVLDDRLSLASDDAETPSPAPSIRLKADLVKGGVDF
jgi:hypothetical protein